MSLEPFLKRELLTSLRRGAAFSDRRGAVVLMTAVVAGWVMVWDWGGWDRASVAGAAGFGLAMFGFIVAAQAILAIAGGFAQVASRIDSERDRKSLDALLTTRFSSAEIVLGSMAASLLRYANSIAATLPVVALIVILGGIDPRLVMVAGAGLIATWFAVGARPARVPQSHRVARADSGRKRGPDPPDRAMQKWPGTKSDSHGAPEGGSPPSERGPGWSGPLHFFHTSLSPFCIFNLRPPLHARKLECVARWLGLSRRTGQGGVLSPQGRVGPRRPALGIVEIPGFFRGTGSSRRVYSHSFFF